MGAKEVAIAAAKKAGNVILKHAEKHISYKKKSAHDVVTKADYAAEKVIISAIKKHYPSHAIFSEEAGKEQLTSDYLWIVDPLDGTVNFANRIPHYCVSIALAKKGEVILGVIYQPLLKELYVAEKGKGATLNGKKIRVSDKTKLIDSILSVGVSTHVSVREHDYRNLGNFEQKVRAFRNSGSSALNLAYIAAGRFDIFFKSKFNYWDFAAGLILVNEAGGKVTDYKGKKITGDSKTIIATNKKFHSRVLKMIKSR